MKASTGKLANETQQRQIIRESGGDGGGIRNEWFSGLFNVASPSGGRKDA